MIAGRSTSSRIFGGVGLYAAIAAYVIFALFLLMLMVPSQLFLIGQFDLMKKYKLMPVVDYPTGPGFVTKDSAASVIDLAKQGKR